jgi:site-specific DNA-methyltransferase (adenine-specific)/site-specific DNA-methyltransferase (cytosine-N4-specific)
MKVNYVITGDSNVKLGLTNLIHDESVDLVFTSPPYTEQRKKIYNSIPQKEYVDWFMKISKHIHRILKPTGSFVINIKENVRKKERQTYVIELILEMKKNGWVWIDEYCWFKTNSFPGYWENRFRDTWERVLHFSKQTDIKFFRNNVQNPIGDWSKKRLSSSYITESDLTRKYSSTGSGFHRKVSNWIGKKTVDPHNGLKFKNENYLITEDDKSLLNTNVIELPPVNKSGKNVQNHSASFPLQLPHWFIRLLTEEGDLVLDPFCGIGTTNISSILLNRNHIGIDIEKRFVSQARKNIKSIHLSTSNPS